MSPDQPFEPDSDESRPAPLPEIEVSEPHDQNLPHAQPVAAEPEAASETPAWLLARMMEGYN